jgi:endonuclease/exonuclease/phosphatase family metal-dependent hydrolase
MKITLFCLLFVSTQVWAKWSVSTFNIRNFDKDPSAGQTNLAELQKVINFAKSDVMAFEEVVNVTAFKSLMAVTLPDYKYEISSCGGFGKQQLALAYDPKVFTWVSSAEDRTFSGPSASACGSLRPLFLVTLEQKTTKKLFVFGVAHLKAGGDARAFSQRWDQYKKLKKIAATHETKDLILLGDFNTTGYNIKNEDYVQFEEFLSEGNLRTMSENVGCTSYWEGTDGGAEQESSILDHIVLQNKNAALVQDVIVGSHCAKMACRPATIAELGVTYQAVSDHCPVQVIFK